LCPDHGLPFPNPCKVRVADHSRLYEQPGFQGKARTYAARLKQGRMIEGKGVSPSVPVEMSPDQLLAGEDAQMNKALELSKTV